VRVVPLRLGQIGDTGRSTRCRNSPRIVERDVAGKRRSDVKLATKLSLARYAPFTPSRARKVCAPKHRYLFRFDRRGVGSRAAALGCVDRFVRRCYALARRAIARARPLELLA